MFLKTFLFSRLSVSTQKSQINIIYFLRAARTKEIKLFHRNAMFAQQIKKLKKKFYFRHSLLLLFLQNLYSLIVSGSYFCFLVSLCQTFSFVLSFLLCFYLSLLYFRDSVNLLSFLRLSLFHPLVPMYYLLSPKKLDIFYCLLYCRSHLAYH